MKQSSSSSVKLTLKKCRLSVEIGNSDNDDHATTETKEIESVSKQLREIRDLLETRAHKEQEQRCEDDKENEMKNDWMLAAAVLDRICAIAFTAVFVGGTVAFFVVFLIHP